MYEQSLLIPINRILNIFLLQGFQYLQKGHRCSSQTPDWDHGIDNCNKVMQNLISHSEGNNENE